MGAEQDHATLSDIAARAFPDDEEAQEKFVGASMSRLGYKPQTSWMDNDDDGGDGDDGDDEFGFGGRRKAKKNRGDGGGGRRGGYFGGGK